jgi:hypothetical protein
MQPHQTFLVSDLNLAAWLCCQGYQALELVPCANHRAAFAFPETPTRHADCARYFTGGHVSALDFVRHLKALKVRAAELRRQNLSGGLSTHTQPSQLNATMPKETDHERTSLVR